MNSKECSKCKVVKSFDEFHKDKLRKDGCQSVCKECRKQYQKKYQPQYYEDNRERVIRRSIQYNQDNKERLEEYQKQYYQDNRERVIRRSIQYRQDNKAKINEYYQANKEKINERSKQYRQDNKAKINEYHRNRRKNNPAIALRHNVSVQVSMTLSRSAGNKNGESVMKYLPYTIEQLKEHIEKQLQPWMTWENYGEWHIDHIYPHSKLPYDSMEHPNFLKAWALENLQPLEAKENIRKGNKV
jgi:transketolase